MSHSERTLTQDVEGGFMHLVAHVHVWFDCLAALDAMKWQLGK